MAEGIQIKNLPSTTAIKQGDTMTIVQDKQNKQLALDVFANESDLATLSPLENRCDEVKAKIEVDEYSAEITTSQSISEIGSDDNGANLHENVLDGAYESCVLKGKTKYIDNDTQEILDTFQEGRNLSLIDVKSPILSNVGKNLFTTNNMRTGNIAGNGSSIEGNDISGNWQVTDYIPVKPLIKYYHSTSLYKFEKVSFYDINKKIIYGTGVNNFKTGVISTPHQCAYARYVVMKDSSTNNSLSLEELVSNNDIVVTQGGSNIAYEPYKSNTTTFDQKDGKTIVLRSLPNGVCDTLNVETGEYIQRIGEVIKNNATGFNLSSGGWENKSDVCSFENFRPEGMKAQEAKDKPTLNCDKVPSNTFSTQWNNSKGIESITQHGGGGIVLSITRDKLLIQDVDGLNTYLQSNPLTIQYELATPIVSTIDVQGFPYAYENGHVQLSSGSIEQSLTPTVTYKVPVSRVGQIASNTKSNLRQTIKLDQLEVLVYQSLINTEYENLLVQNSAESATSFTNLSTNDPKDELYYMLNHLIEEDQPVQNMLDKINLFYLYGLLNDEHYFDLLLGGEEDVY